MNAEGKKPRDIIVDTITPWVGDDHKIYDYADRMIADLYDAGYDITRRSPFLGEPKPMRELLDEWRAAQVAAGHRVGVAEEIEWLLEQLDED